MICYAERLTERIRSQRRARWDEFQISGREQHCQDLNENKVCCVDPIARVFQTSQDYIQSLQEAAYHAEKQINLLRERIESLVRL